MGGSALDVMCALFLPQWSELKACEKPIQSLLPAGLCLVPTAWACRRSPSPRTRAVSLFQPLKEEHPAVEDKTAKSPCHGAEGPKQEHDADPSDGLSAKASVVSRAIRPCLHGDRTAIWRQKRWLEKVDGLVRREDCWATPRTSCAEVRWGESSSATACAFPRLSHWEVFAPQQGVLSVRPLVSKAASSGALLLYSFMICGKNDRTMCRLGLLFEMKKAKKLTEEE
ncbi:hypothetical protein WA577_007400 [Blastocystis sp. JDR]